MKGYFVYRQIQQLREMGFRKSAVARQLGLDWRTVDRYWEMDVDAYEQKHEQVCRTCLLEEYEAVILGWLREYPTMSAAQVSDWLKEHYAQSFSERTVSRYVNQLREKHDIKKIASPREYEAVAELPPGKQLQVDFGEKWMETVEGSRIKVRFAAFVLSHSRQKYVDFQSRPFTASDLVRACRNSFRYYGGLPRELVFDQDSVVVVSENCGDVIHTYEFEKLRQELKLSVYVCRGSDPESKGKIESVVKYVKGNFLENRLYSDDETLNFCALEWLERTANARPHGTTKRPPAEMFAEEREHLRPLPDVPESQGAYICRTVRKDNTIVYDSNRYSLPYGTYTTQKEVRIIPKDGTLHICTVFSEPICEHVISPGRGYLIKNQNHSRNREDSLDRAQAELDAKLGFEASDFLQVLRTEKSRYARDQFRLLSALCDKYGAESTLDAIRFCLESKLYSANYVKDYLAHKAQPAQTAVTLPIPASDSVYHVTTEKRPLEVYAKAGGML